MTSTVSVIIPTFNREKLLKRSIKSVLNQTYPNLECLVVDDGSTDNTKDVIMNFNDNRINYIKHKLNKHASAARNTGIQAAKGDYIAFLDDDDEWLPEKLKKQVYLLEQSSINIGLVYCWMTYLIGEKELYNYTPTLKGYIFNDMLDKQAIGNSSTLLVRRNIIGEIGGFDESLPRGNDGDFIRRVCRKYEVDYVPEVLVKVYTGHGNQRISSNNKESIKNAIKGEKIKFSKFHKELNALPEQKSNIYTHIGNHYAALRHFKSAFRYYLKAIIASPKNYKTLIKKMIS